MDDREATLLTLADVWPPTEVGMWMAIRPAERAAWLVAARDRFFSIHSRAIESCPSRRIFLSIDGIQDVTDFLCALGESVNGPGGYYGRNLESLEDCLIGGFGADSPWVLVVSDLEGLAARLDCRALEHYALARSREVPEEFTADLLRLADEGASGRWTLWEAIHAVFTHCGVTVAQCGSGGDPDTRAEAKSGRR